MVFFASRAVSREAARPSSHRALPLPSQNPRGGTARVLTLSSGRGTTCSRLRWTRRRLRRRPRTGPPSSDVSILGTNTLADDFASSSGECSSLASAARDKSVFTYDVPKQCAMMMVCAGSPRAASTAHCMIAEHVLKKMMGVLAFKDPEGSAHDQPQYTGYWNYHLHSLCDDGENCDIFDGHDRSVDEFEGKIPTMNGLDTEERKNLAEAMGEVRTSLAQLAAVDAESVVVVKTHEFDAHLMSACAKRLVLTSFRDKEEVFDSGLELGWFTQPKEVATVVQQSVRHLAKMARVLDGGGGGGSVPHAPARLVVRRAQLRGQLPRGGPAAGGDDHARHEHPRGRVQRRLDRGRGRQGRLPGGAQPDDDQREPAHGEGEGRGGRGRRGGGGGRFRDDGREGESRRHARRGEGGGRAGRGRRGGGGGRFRRRRRRTTKRPTRPRR